VYEGAKNNLPDAIAHLAAVDIYNQALSCTEKDILLVLMSGGGSALLPLPTPPIGLEEKLQAITVLSQAGATIRQLNTVRKHLSMVKGGRLALAAYPAQVLHRIDVYPSCYSNSLCHHLGFVTNSV
jgi:glycerate kinase